MAGRRGLILVLLFLAANGRAASYLIEPAPRWAAVAEAVSPEAAPRFYLAPLKDKRGTQEVWSGHGYYDRVLMEPAGATLMAKAWGQRPYSAISYLFQRQLAYALGSAGYRVTMAEEPFVDDAAALVAAHLAGAQYLIQGQLKRLNLYKRGADAFLGTDLSGNNYTMNLDLDLQVLKVENAQKLLEEPLSFQRVFCDPTRLGSDDSVTFPRYFALGLPALALRVTDDAKLRQLAGLPTVTPSPTQGSAPEASAAPAPSPLPTATPDMGPYWVNPKTGKAVDPSWNFDPSDGTPRDKFVLHQGDPLPTTTQVPEPK
jgi:hypothetical protein